jgi:hypothetical protein
MAIPPGGAGLIVWTAAVVGSSSIVIFMCSSHFRMAYFPSKFVAPGPVLVTVNQ